MTDGGISGGSVTGGLAGGVGAGAGSAAGSGMFLQNGTVTTFSVSGGNVATISDAIAGDATQSAALAATGNGTGTSAIVKTGAGTLILTGANSYTGGTTVSAGILQGNTASLPGNIINNAALVFDQATTGTYAGAISGTGAMTKQNTGTLILTGANSYTGGTTISAGTLQGNSTSLQGNIVNNAALVFDQAATGTYAGVISGTGTMTKQNAGTLTLTGANSYSGGTTIGGGTLLVAPSAFDRLGRACLERRHARSQRRREHPDFRRPVG